jgi:hypothetical protein
MSFEQAIPSIEEIELQAGAIKLTRPERKAAAPKERPPARIITMVWGDRYIADLLAITVPALLAPGNLPAFVEHFDSEFVIVTETRLFDMVSRSPVISQVLSHCDVRLVPVDDLLSSWYGITLTYALVRGFVDLGAAMVGAHLVFLNADFIVADGSYATLAQRILRGERLVVSPSYCMVQEDTIDPLRDHYDPLTHALAIPHRKLAAMILARRHNTIRAKTVNQRLFRIHRYDQFYWYVDDDTLLCRQMPIAVVYMRPERVLTEMPTFWDYGVISEYCPTATPCVLGDSDDFLMAELRTEGTFAELLHLGWPDTAEIAADLSSFTTTDHHNYGRHTLVLHSADLPAAVDEGKKALAAFVDQIYARLSPPISYRNHPFWAPAFPRFLAAYQQRKQESETRGQALALLLQQNSEADARRKRIAELRRRIRGVTVARSEGEAEAAAYRQRVEQQLALFEREYLERSASLEKAAAVQLAATERNVRVLREDLASLEADVAKLVAAENQQIDQLLGIAAPLENQGAAPAATKNRRLRMVVPPKSKRERTVPPKVPLPFSRELLAPWYYRFFGRLPRTTAWHPYHTVLRAGRSAIVAAGEVDDILLISSGSTLGPLLVRDTAARKLSISPRMVTTGRHREMVDDERKFPLCVCDLAFDDLLSLRELLDNVRPLLASGARIVVFHHNNPSRNLDASIYSFTRGTFPLFGTSRISFTGSWSGTFAARLFERTLNRAASRGTLLVLALTLGLAAPFARLAAYRESRRSRQQYPRHCTSMTIEIET